nr:hypothetical protein [Burkholderia cepacia]
MLLIEDGLNTRSYLSTPGEDLTQENKNGNFVPTRPDSFVAVLEHVKIASTGLAAGYRHASDRHPPVPHVLRHGDVEQPVGMAGAVAARQSAAHRSG